MITGSEMGVVDANAEALGVPRKQLMESAGKSVADVATTLADAGDRIHVVAGRGNNGGDGFVAARFLEAFDVSVSLLGRAESITTEIAAENWNALEACAFDVREIRDSANATLPAADLIVDAMLGTGIHGELREPAATLARAMNDTTATVLSVDVPSGMNGDTGEIAPGAVEADHVVTFHETKPGLEALDATVHVADIGIPAAAELFVERGDLRRIDRESASHKGDNGDVLVIGGGPYSGAPAHAATAALRAGADLARVLVPEHIRSELQGYSPDLIVRGYDAEQFSPAALDAARTMADNADTTILGPGIGTAEDTRTAIGEFLADQTGRIVVDADALSVVPAVDTDANLLCTPHQGELVAMGGDTSDDWRKRRDLVESFAADLGHTLLVKGAHDVISDGERTRVSRTGNPGMTVGGTGDVLAGVAGALAAVLPVHNAAAVAAYANGRAGDIAAENRGHGLTATDVVEHVPRALWPDGIA